MQKFISYKVLVRNLRNINKLFSLRNFFIDIFLPHCKNVIILYRLKRKQNRKTKQRRNSCNIEHTQDLSFKPNAVFIYNVACKINCKRNKYYQGKIKSSVAVESKNHEHSYGHRKGKYSKNRIRFCLYILNKPENNYKSIKKKSKHQYHKEELNA